MHFLSSNLDWPLSLFPSGLGIFFSRHDPIIMDSLLLELHIFARMHDRHLSQLGMIFTSVETMFA